MKCKDHQLINSDAFRAPDKVYIWGIGDTFKRFYFYLKTCESKGDFIIEGYISRNRTKELIDGKNVLYPNDIKKMESNYDYIIIMTEKFYQDIVEYAVDFLHIDRKKLIDGKIFGFLNFNWKRYIKIYHSNLSIIAEACLGGGIYASIKSSI